MIIAVLGSRQSGKTTAIEIIIQELTKKGRRVAAIKHIPEGDFTMDTEQKDTWRYAEAGAQVAAAVAPNEIAIIKKVDTSNFSLEKIVQMVDNNYDLLVFEGFRKLVEKDYTVKKIVATKTIEEVSEALRRYRPILAFVGFHSFRITELQIPYINLIREPEKLAKLVNEELEVPTEGD